jgi:hypothetical protein
MIKITAFMLLLIVTTIAHSQDLVKFSDGKNKVEFKNSSGKIIIPAKYDAAWDNFSEGLVGIVLQNKWGYIDTTGKLVIPCKYDEVGSFNADGFVRVYIAKGEFWGMIDKKGKEIIPVKYDEVGEKFRYNLVSVRYKGKCGIMNNKGKLIIPFNYEYCTVAQDHFVIVTKDKKKGLVNTVVFGMDEKTKAAIPYEFVLPIKYDNIYALSATLYVKVLDGKYGLINNNNMEFLPCEYRVIGLFDNGKARVRAGDNSTFYIDTTGKRIF